MITDKIIFNWFVVAASLGAALFAVKTGWYWQSSSDVMTTDELAGLSDGHNALDEAIEAFMSQSATIAKGARAVPIAAILAACALVAHWL